MELDEAKVLKREELRQASTDCYKKILDMESTLNEYFNEHEKANADLERLKNRIDNYVDHMRRISRPQEGKRRIAPVEEKYEDVDELLEKSSNKRTGIENFISTAKRIANHFSKKVETMIEQVDSCENIQAIKKLETVSISKEFENIRFEARMESLKNEWKEVLSQFPRHFQESDDRIRNMYAKK